MNADAPKISIITVTLNAASDLRRTLESIVSQDWAKTEVIVVDGGSADETKQVIGQFAGRINHWVSEPDKGIYDAMNKGLAKATGDWVNFMNAGDVFHNDHALTSIFQHVPEDAQVIYGDSIAQYPSFKAFRKARPVNDLWKGMICCHQAMFIHTDLVRNDGYKTGLDFSADYELTLRLCCSGKNFTYIPETIAVFDTRGKSNVNMAKSARSNLEILKSFRLLTPNEKRFHRWFIFQSKFTEWIYKMLPSGFLNSVLKWYYRKQIVHE